MCLTGVIYFYLAKSLRDALYLFKLDYIWSLGLNSAGFYLMYSTVLGTLIAVKPLEDPGVSVFPTGGLPELLMGL